MEAMRRKPETSLERARVLITGAAGTVGQELTAQLVDLDIAELRLLDSNETELFFLMEAYRHRPRVHAFLGDVRDEDKLVQMMRNIDVVFHAAALKHVTVCERAPFDAVQTNIEGVHHIIKAAQVNGVRRALFTSSDKAVNPTNVMGTTKLMGERLFTAANALASDVSDPVFGSTRFGNVAGSRGSVVPVFLQQIERGGPVTLTDREMTRFVMTIHEAVSLVIKSALMMCGGEVFIAKMPVLRIEDLALEMIELLAPHFGHAPKDIEVIEIGAKPGEKRYEELMSEEETRRSVELADFFVVLPAFRNEYSHIEYAYPEGTGARVSRAYRSDQEPPMTRAEVREFLLQPGVLPIAIRSAVLAKEAACVS